MQNNVNMKLNRNRMLNRRVIVGGFLALHGAMHAMMLGTPRPDGGAGNFVTRGGDAPLLNALGIAGAGAEAIGAALLVISAVGFLAAGLLILRSSRPKLWQDALVASAAISTATMALFWNDWMVAAPIINLAAVGLVLACRRNPAILEA